jgi:cytochrome c peroxidase
MYSSLYQAAFPSSDIPDPGTLPPNGKPGDPAYDDLDAAQKSAVTRVFVNVGKAIAAYERTFRVKPNSLDAYARGDHSALTSMQKQGLSMFTGAGCMQCHWGPRLTDDAFHVTRTPTGRSDGLPDRGRADGLARLVGSEFLAWSAWSDAPSATRAIGLNPDDAPMGAFKTPPLRGVGGAGPFGHGGMQSTLVDVVDAYGAGGLPSDDPRATGEREPWIEHFDVTAQWSIASFLATLTADPILP